MTGPAEPGPASEEWGEWRRRVDLDAYDERWQAMTAAGENPHGEADLVGRYSPSSVLDAGCGTGRVGIELARRGIEVEGTDLDPDLLARARAKAPELRWHQADLARLDLGRTFEAVVLAGNVVGFVARDDRPKAVVAAARHVAAGGVMISGWTLRPGWPTVAEYDSWCATAGLVLEDRFATWAAAPFVPGGDYVVSVHRVPGP